MKCLFFLFLAFLLCLSEVSSQKNPNMFDFDMICYDSSSPACGRTVADIYERAGQIISDNLILTRRISVVITVQNSGYTTYFGNYALQLTFIIKLLLISVLTSTCFIASTYSSQQPYNDPVNG